jgi:HSP20 family protein
VSLNEDGNLSIAIENKMEHKEENKKEHYLRREFSYTNYQQNYSLPEDVVKDKISARVENGILTVTLPKQEKEAKVSKSIQIS